MLNNTAPKLKAAGKYGALSAAALTLIFVTLSSYGVHVPDQVVAAVSSFVSVAITFFAGYQTTEKGPDDETPPQLYGNQRLPGL